MSIWLWEHYIDDAEAIPVRVSSPITPIRRLQFTYADKSDAVNLDK